VFKPGFQLVDNMKDTPYTSGILPEMNDNVFRKILAFIEENGDVFKVINSVCGYLVKTEDKFPDFDKKITPTIKKLNT
jgi:hypothetical protein